MSIKIPENPENPGCFTWWCPSILLIEHFWVLVQFLVHVPKHCAAFHLLTYCMSRLWSVYDPRKRLSGTSWAFAARHFWIRTPKLQSRQRLTLQSLLFPRKKIRFVYKTSQQLISVLTCLATMSEFKGYKIKSIFYLINWAFSLSKIDQ